MMYKEYTGQTKHIINSMEQSPSSEANMPSASQEIPCILRNSEVH